MVFDILTVLPQFFSGFLENGVVGRAIHDRVIAVNIINIRDFSSNKHRNTDDYTYGGGPGMVMQPQPTADAVKASKRAHSNAKVIYFSPQGVPLSQSLIKQLFCNEHQEEYILLCGRYEGLDQRVIDRFVDIEISLGDFILSGGEIPAMAFVDAMARYVPGVLGNSETLEEESFENDLLEYPQYTRPEDFDGDRVPQVLLSGNHSEIEKWRRLQRLKTTLIKRPDLLNRADLSSEEKRLLREINK